MHDFIISCLFDCLGLQRPSGDRDQMESKVTRYFLKETEFLCAMDFFCVQLCNNMQLKKGIIQYSAKLYNTEFNIDDII